VPFAACPLRRIVAKLRDALFHPLQTGDLVLDAVCAGTLAAFLAEFRMSKETHGPDAIGHAEQNDTFARPPFVVPLFKLETYAKAMKEGLIPGVTNYDTQFPATVEEARAFVAASHARGLPVFIHANREQAQAFALAAGVDVIAHGMWRDRNEDAVLDARAREILGTIARDGIGYQPTTQVMVGLRDMLDDRYLARPELADACPAVRIDWYASEEGGWFVRQMRSNAPDGETVIRGTSEGNPVRKR